MSQSADNNPLTTKNPHMQPAYVHCNPVSAYLFLLSYILSRNMLFFFFFFFNRIILCGKMQWIVTIFFNWILFFCLTAKSYHDAACSVINFVGQLYAVRLTNGSSSLCIDYPEAKMKSEINWCHPTFFLAANDIGEPIEVRVTTSLCSSPDRIVDRKWSKKKNRILGW